MSSYTSDVLKFHKEQLEKRKKMEQESKELMGLAPELEEMKLETKGKLQPKVKETIDEYRKKLYREAVNIRKRDAIVNNNTEAFQGNSSAINEYIRLYDSTKNDVEKNVEDLYYTKITEIIAKKDAEKIYADILAFDPVDLSYLKEFVFNFTTYKNNLKELRSKNVSYATFIEILKNMIEKNLAVISTFKANNAGLNNNNNNNINMAAPAPVNNTSNNTRIGLNNAPIPGVLQPQKFGAPASPVYPSILQSKNIPIMPPVSLTANLLNTNNVPNVPSGKTDPNAPVGKTDPNAPVGKTDPNVPTIAAPPVGKTDPNAPVGKTDPNAPTVAIPLVGKTDPNAPVGKTDPNAPVSGQISANIPNINQDELDKMTMDELKSTLLELTRSLTATGEASVGRDEKQGEQYVFNLYNLESISAVNFMDDVKYSTGNGNYVLFRQLNLKSNSKVLTRIENIANSGDKAAMADLLVTFKYLKEYGDVALGDAVQNFLRSQGAQYNVSSPLTTVTARTVMLNYIRDKFVQKFTSGELLSNDERSKIKNFDDPAAIAKLMEASKMLGSEINITIASKSNKFKVTLIDDNVDLVLKDMGVVAAAEQLSLRLVKQLYIGCRNIDLYYLCIAINDFGIGKSTIGKGYNINGQGFDKQKKQSERPVSNKYYIDQDELDSGVLTVKYLKNRHNGPIRNTLLSKKLQSIIKDILDGNEYDPDEYKRLSQGDKYILNRFLTLIDKNDAIKDVIDEVKERVHILLGSIAAGNTSDLNISELKELLIFSKNNNILRAGMVADIMKDLGIN